MVLMLRGLNKFVTALPVVLILLLPQPARAVDEAEVDRLFEQLARPEQPGWRQIEDSILLEWSKSGSPAMDLLYQRGQEAMADGNMMAAIDHFSALTDHAPGFAEGWNGRATAFFHAGELGMSVADIERTLALNPRHFGAMSGLAVIFEELGYEPEALEVYRAILAIHPHRPEVLEAIDRLQKTVEGEAL